MNFVNVIQEGAAAAGNDTGTAAAVTTASTKVKFLYIHHTGKIQDGSTTTGDSVYFVLDGGTAAHNAGDAIEIDANECVAIKCTNTTIADIHAISGQSNAGGTSSVKIQCIVAAILDIDA